MEAAFNEAVRRLKAGCLAGERAYCSARCPFGLDVVSFAERLRRGSFSSAYRLYRESVVFPGVISRICPAPCESACPLGQKGDGLRLRALERACAEYAPQRKPPRYRLPDREQTVAVVGGGLSGLACALRLANLKYSVSLYERAEAPGGAVRRLLDPELLERELALEFSGETVEFHYSRPVHSLDRLAADAVYIATGRGGPAFGFEPGDGLTAAGPGVFLGGALCGADPALAAADGVRAAGLIDQYFHGGAAAPLRRETCLPPRRSVPVSFAAFEGELPSREEVRAEAERCLGCGCDFCLSNCGLMTYNQRRSPPRLAEEVYYTARPGSPVGKETFAKRLMSSCNQCGACRDDCPEHLDMGRLLLEGRRELQKQGALAWAFHDFYLRDMEHASGPARAVSVPDPARPCRRVFFPGCQLGGSDPDTVLESWRWLKEQDPNTGLWLDCCGVPAVWAGREDLSDAAFDALRRQWISLGRPEVILACPTCRRTFSAYLPEIPTVSLYERLDEGGAAVPVSRAGERLAVFDPCAARGEPRLRQAIRRLAERSGAALEPLPREGENARCCSWGGHIALANPSMAERQAKDAAAQTSARLVTYCANCRDILAGQGADCVHILELLFFPDRKRRAPPTWTEKRRNRELLRRAVRPEDEQTVPAPALPDLVIPEELRRRMSAEYLLDEDAAAAVDSCERTGRFVTDPESGERAGFAELGRRTCWVRYRPEGDAFRLISCYAHRMKIRTDRV